MYRIRIRIRLKSLKRVCKRNSDMALIWCGELKQIQVIYGIQAHVFAIFSRVSQFVVYLFLFWF